MPCSGEGKIKVQAEGRRKMSRSCRFEHRHHHLGFTKLRGFEGGAWLRGASSRARGERLQGDRVCGKGVRGPRARAQAASGGLAGWEGHPAWGTLFLPFQAPSEGPLSFFG